MRVVLMAIGVFVTAAAGAFIVREAANDSMRARKSLVSELSAMSGRARKVDTIAQQLRAERGGNARAEALLQQAIERAGNPAERASLLEALTCAKDPSCTTSVDALFQPVQDSYALGLQPLWQQVDETEEKARTMLWAGAGVGVLGPLLVVLALSRKSTARVDPPPADGNDHVERLLKERLEALYAARTQLGEGARFAAFGELAAGLSHGLKTPLATILAAAQLAQLKLGPAHPTNSQLDQIVREAEGLNEQVQRFLRAAGSVGPTRNQLDLRRFIATLAKTSTAAAQARGVTFESSVPFDVTIEADESLLEMAMRNLVENALSVAPPGSVVRVLVSPADAPARVGLDHTAPPQSRWVSVSVEDNGPGFPTATHQQQTGVTTKSAGSGLGIAIARRVVERHGGTLVLEDVEGGGARVRAVLPALGPR